MNSCTTHEKYDLESDLDSSIGTGTIDKALVLPGCQAAHHLPCMAISPLTRLSPARHLSCSSDPCTSTTASTTTSSGLPSAPGQRAAAAGGRSGTIPVRCHRTPRRPVSLCCGRWPTLPHPAPLPAPPDPPDIAGAHWSTKRPIPLWRIDFGNPASAQRGSTGALGQCAPDSH